MHRVVQQNVKRASQPTEVPQQRARRQKHLWMIQDPKRQKSVDQEIFEKYGPTLVEMSIDQHNRWIEWCQDTELYCFQGKLAAIVALDQFSRHMHRFCMESADKDTSSFVNLPGQKLMDRRALETA
jgi:uncharacterized protein (DUF924 family)